MKLRLTRILATRNETIGCLYEDKDNSLDFICFILEDQYRKEKVYGETRIPEGVYEIKLRTAGRLHAKYTERFRGTYRGDNPFHQGMLWLQDVPNFTWIYLHIGNDDEDTLGCPLTGSSVVNRNGTYTVRDSTIAYIKMYGRVIDALNEGESVWIEIEDHCKIK